MAKVKKLCGPCPCGCGYQPLEVEGRLGWFPPEKAKKKLAQAKEEKPEKPDEDEDEDEDKPEKPDADKTKGGFWD